MKIAAIIAEYNPFHSGHKFHIEETKKIADAVIVIMSGSFVQRGECAIYSKFARAKAATLSGADLVLELPFLYSTASSRDFAYGAVKILNALNVVDCLSFGSESGDIEFLKKLASYEETIEFKSILKTLIAGGMPYPRAKMITLENCRLPFTEDPNDLLATDYIGAINSLGSKIAPVCIKRTVAHDSSTEADGFLSASAIRNKIREESDVSYYLPHSFSEKPLFYESLSPLIAYSVMNLSKEDYPVRGKADSDLIATIKNTPFGKDINSYLYNIKSKRYTMSRVKRTLLHILLNSGEKIPEFSPYARVLSLNTTGAEILKRIKKESDIKIITKPDSSYEKENISFALDVKATDVRNMVLSKESGEDYLVSPFVLK
ncbi:MAG: nucleotidyltransferase family protein [Clostridia bacterium]|nr:nucleotidyltransferase family protein [Clostridia bacterium]